VNLVGGEVVDVAKLNLEKEESVDDGSGVHDFPPEQVDRYLAYPTVMLQMVRYVRRELVRLQAVSDEDIMDGNFELLKFGKVDQS
jgi:cytochrome b pre-mRNA-processing protein 3